MITEQILTDIQAIPQTGEVRVRTITIIFRDGVEIGRLPPHRISYGPGAIVTGQTAYVNSIIQSTREEHERLKQSGSMGGTIG